MVWGLVVWLVVVGVTLCCAVWFCFVGGAVMVCSVFWLLTVVWSLLELWSDGLVYYVVVCGTGF